MKISIELKDEDLAHFRQALKKAKRMVRDADEDEIIQAAETVIGEIVDTEMPDFVSSRLSLLQLMTRMVRDEEWALGPRLKNRVMCALVYFADPEDIIPDELPGIGFLDDAIMIELVFRELRHELDAYRDFCAYRDDFVSKNPNATREQRAWKLGSKRESLHDRMQRRREKDQSHSAQGIAPLF